MPLKPGDAVTVISGPFEGQQGLCRAIDGDEIEVELSLFGRVTKLTLERAELAGSDGIDVSALEQDVRDAVARRGFNQRREFFWRQEVAALGTTPDFAALEALSKREETFRAALLAEQAAATDALLAGLHARFDPLAPRERLGVWLAERATWTSWEAEARDALAAVPHYTPLADQGFIEAVDAQRELQQALDRWRLRQELAAPRPEAREPALEAAIDAAPESDAAFLVYGDWLSARGEPRGHLVSEHAAGRRAPREELALLGAFGRAPGVIVSDWHLGFPAKMVVEATRDDERHQVDVARLVEVLWAGLNGRFLRELEVRCASAHETGVMDRVFSTWREGGPRPTVRSLALTTNETEEMLSWTSLPDLGPLARVFPSLRSMRVHVGYLELGALDFPQLEELELHVVQLDAARLASLSRVKWPRLRRLSLWFGSRSYGVETKADELAPLLDALPPSVVELGVANCEFTDEACALLLRHPIAARLESLDLSMGTMTGEGADLLAASPAKFPKLRALDVDDNYLGPGALQVLRDSFPFVHSREQREAELYEGVLHRYASVGE
ncbi:MAG: TIGR02996 domain-containing protein [Myxococcaceae bacterium]